MRVYFLLIAFFFCASCQRDDETYFFDGHHQLEMVLNVQSEELDTLYYFDGPGFSFERRNKIGQLKFLFYKEEQLIRVFDSNDTKNEYSLENGNWRFENATYYSGSDSLMFSLIYYDNQRVLSDYYCLIDYPFEGINCFKLVAE